MAHRSTYYSDTEEAELETIAEERDESFSGVVREAIQSYYNISNE